MSLEVKSPWQYEHLVDVIEGVNFSKEAEGLEKNELSKAINVYYNDDKIFVDSGYKTFLEPVRGTARAQFQFFFSTGGDDNLLFTNYTIYKEASDTWQYLHDGDAVATAPTLSVAGVATDLTVTVTSITGFSDGDYIGIQLDDGTQHKTTVNGAPVGSVITFDDALPIGADIGNTVVKAVDLAGDDNEQFSFVVLSGFDYLVFTNGVDTVKYYDKTNVKAVPNLPSAGNTVCKSLTVINNILLLINTTEGGTAHPQRVRWSDVADITNWATGISGYNDLYDTEDHLKTGVPLGPYIILYKERTIIRMEYIGAADKTFDFDTRITGEGAKSVDGVISIGSEHIFIGSSNVYKYQGGFDLEALGSKVYDKLFSKNKDLNSNFANRQFLLYIEELDEVWLFYPDINGTYPNNIARINLANDAWSFRELNISISGYGFYSTTSTLLWSELIGSWLDQTWKWGGSLTQAGSPITILLSGTQTYSYDYIQSQDDGVDIPWQIESKELYNPEQKMRSNFLDIRAKGGSIIVEYSIDTGNSWLSWGSATFDSIAERKRIHKQVIFERIRFRLRGTESGVSINWFGLKFMPESQH